MFTRDSRRDHDTPQLQLKTPGFSFHVSMSTLYQRVSVCICTLKEYLSVSVLSKSICLYRAPLHGRTMSASPNVTLSRSSVCIHWGEIRTGSRSEVVGSGSGGWAVEDPGSQIGRQRSRAKTGARRIHDARWRVAFAMAGGGARAPDRMISARVTLRGGYKKCRLQ